MKKSIALVAAFACVALYNLQEVVSDAPSAPLASQRVNEDVDQLRTTYLDLIEQEAEKLSARQLQEKIAFVTKSIRDQQANEMLKQAEALLKQIGDQFPHTTAAGKANNALSALQGSFLPQPVPAPRLDPRS